MLEAGMTFTEEPSLLLDGRFGVRIEDVVVCADGRRTTAEPARRRPDSGRLNYPSGRPKLPLWGMTNRADTSDVRPRTSPAARETPMTAAQVEESGTREIDVVVSWRFEELLRAGADAGSALILAGHTEVDLHEATRHARARLSGGAGAPDHALGDSDPPGRSLVRGDVSPPVGDGSPPAGREQCGRHNHPRRQGDQNDCGTVRDARGDRGGGALAGPLREPHLARLSPGNALVIASHLDVELLDAIVLLQRGCPPHLLLPILGD